MLPHPVQNSSKPRLQEPATAISLFVEKSGVASPAGSINSMAHRKSALEEGRGGEHEKSEDRISSSKGHI